jgi:hypothetical protein
LSSKPTPSAATEWEFLAPVRPSNVIRRTRAREDRLLSNADALSCFRGEAFAGEARAEVTQLATVSPAAYRTEPRDCGKLVKMDPVGGRKDVPLTV